MIYLTEGNTPLNEAYNDEIVQERNNTYQLTFRFPTSDPKWELLKEETFLTADDLHGEQDFYIFEVEKQQGYIQVYANQVISLLNNYIVSSIDVDRVSGTRALSALAGSITRTNPFSFSRTSTIGIRLTSRIRMLWRSWPKTSTLFLVSGAEIWCGMATICACKNAVQK